MNTLITSSIFKRKGDRVESLDFLRDFWILAIEFQYYILMALLFPLFLQSTLTTRAVTVMALVLLHYLFPQSYLFFAHSLYFLAGIITFQLAVRIIKIPEFIIMLSAILFLMYLQYDFISVLVVAITVLMILFFRKAPEWGGFLGLISYSMYLVHVPIEGRLLMLTNRYVHSEWIKSLLILVFMVFTIFIAWLFYLMIEKPSKNLSKGVYQYKKTKEAQRIF